MGEPINYEQRRDLERHKDNERPVETDNSNTIALWLWLQARGGR
jgi:hypothetical protein